MKAIRYENLKFIQVNFYYKLIKLKFIIYYFLLRETVMCIQGELRILYYTHFILKNEAIWHRRGLKELNGDRVSRFCGFHELSDNDSDEGQS